MRHRWNRMWFCFHFTGEHWCTERQRPKFTEPFISFGKSVNGNKVVLGPWIPALWIGAVLTGLRSQRVSGRSGISTRPPVPPLITHCVSLASSNPVPDRVQAVIRSDRRDLDTSTNKQLRKQIFKRKGFLPSADWFLLKVLILFNIFCSSPEMHCRALSAFCFGQVFTERQQFGCFLQKKWLQVQSRQPGIR